MSNIKNNIPLHRISVPALTDVKYASSLDDALKNINENFAVLANKDFIKGEAGSSVTVVEEPIFDNAGNLTRLGNLLKECIETQNINNESTTIKHDGIELSLWDNFTPEKAGKLHMIYNITSTGLKSEPISSLYYVFLDGRFATNNLGTIDASIYNDVKDLSCIIVYDAGEFKILENAFPTIYYESGVGLCWKINGCATAIPIQGLPGKDGMDSRLNIVKCDNVITDNTKITATVTSIYSPYLGYISVDEVTDIDNYNDATALIITKNSTNGNDFYFGYTYVSTAVGDTKKVLYAQCDQETSITSGIEMEQILNAFKNISLFDNNNLPTHLKGLFIPITDEKDNAQPVHLISATAITNTEGSTTSKNSDIIFTPVNDINGLTVDENNPLKIDKYLYLKLNTNRTLVTNGCNNFGDDIESYNYVLKYKLTNRINKVDSLYFDVMNADNVGSRYLGCVYKSDKDYSTDDIIQLNENNIKYYNTNTFELSDNHIDTMPIEFRNRLGDEQSSNVLGIYRWELCNEWAEYDVDDLKNVSDALTGYNFPEAFKVIYTTTINPSVSTDVMWFNGCEIANSNYFNTNTDDYDGFYYGKYIIPGWNNGANDSVFTFVKFVPLYNNAFRTDEDTAFNVNYNVNITGDSLDSTRNLTVHGSINCDNLSVYDLTATGKIKNIYTQETIVGDAGIKLAASENGLHQFEVNANADVVCNDINAHNVTGNNVNADTVSSRQTVTNELFVNNSDNERQIYIGNDKNNGNFDIEINDAYNISIEHDYNNSNDNLGNNTSLPAITNNLTLLNDNNANIIVSNQDKGSDDLCYYGVSANNAGVGVVGNSNYVVEPSCEVVKNFNIHRISEGTNTTTTSFADFGENLSGYTSAYSLINDNYLLAKTEHSAHQNTTLEQADFTSMTANRNLAIQKYVIQNKNISSKFNTAKNIEITFSTYTNYVVGIGIKGKNDNSRWPILHSDSNMKLELWCEITDLSGKVTTFKIDEHKYSIDYTTNSISNDSGYDWHGYDKDGNSLRSYYSMYWRYNEYMFKPKSFVISPNTNPESSYNKIVNAFNNGYKIELYVYPKFTLYAKSQKYGSTQKKLIGGVSVYGPIPVNLTSPSNDTKLIQTGAPDNGWKYTKYQKNASTIRYSYSSATDDSGVKSTNMCDDGFVVRSGNYTFGLGQLKCAVNHNTGGYGTNTDGTWNGNVYYEDVPALFYHEINTNYKGNGTNNTDYAKRTNAIPLKDIFEAIQFINTYKDKIKNL